MSQEGTAKLQRALTVEFLSKRRLNTPAIWLRPHSDSPDAADAIADKLDVDLGAWDGPEHNLGVRLVDGHIELAFKSGDDAFAHAFFLAAEHLRIDARAAFGVDRISSVILKIEDQELIETWAARWPRGFKDKHGHWTETKVVVSSPAAKSARAVWRNSKPLPGSIVPEGVVVWRPKGKAAALDVDIGIEDLEPRTIAPTGMDTLIRALAYATLAYWVRTYLDGLTAWDSILTGRIGGWLARVEVEGRNINAKGKSLEGMCWSPIDTREQALDLVVFLGKLGADGNLKIAYLQGESQLIRDPLTKKIASWTALEETFGVQAKIGIRRAFNAGLDIEIIERMSDQYVYDISTGDYVDREAIPLGQRYDFPIDRMTHRHSNDFVTTATKKRVNAFTLYTQSKWRTDVVRCDMFPSEEPAALLRYSPVHGIVTNEEIQLEECRILNSFRGFIIKPAGIINQETMKYCVSAVDEMLGYLTQENDAQMWWLKKFIAWTIQHPEMKQQSCPVIIGGQGIGKSLFGNVFMRALFGELAGHSTGAALESLFLLTPFLNKLIVFIDEIRLESSVAVNEIKKIVREIDISGEMKFGHRQTYRVFSRLLLTANHVDIGLSSADAVDRALFFIMAWNAESKRMTDIEFNTWTLTLKEFYAKFSEELGKATIRQHLMRYFRDIECTRAELEDLKYSSRNDPAVVSSYMSPARLIARELVQSARIHEYKDITAWFDTNALRAAIRRAKGSQCRVEASSVMMEFERAGVIERARDSGDMRKFKWGYFKICEVMGAAHGLLLETTYAWRPGDNDANDVRSTEGAPDWRGIPKKAGDNNRHRPFNPSDDPDYLESE